MTRLNCKIREPNAEWDLSLSEYGRFALLENTRAWPTTLEIGNIRGDFMWKAGRVQIVQQTSLNRGTRFLEISWSDYHWMATAAHVFQVDDNDGLWCSLCGDTWGSVSLVPWGILRFPSEIRRFRAVSLSFCLWNLTDFMSKIAILEKNGPFSITRWLSSKTRIWDKWLDFWLKTAF